MDAAALADEVSVGRLEQRLDGHGERAHKFALLVDRARLVKSLHLVLGLRGEV